MPKRRRNMGQAQTSPLKLGRTKQGIPQSNTCHNPHNHAMDKRNPPQTSPHSSPSPYPTPSKINKYRMPTCPNGTDISILGRSTKHLPDIPRGQNFRGHMDIHTNQKAVEHRLGNLELQESHSPRYRWYQKKGNPSSHQ